MRVICNKNVLKTFFLVIWVLADYVCLNNDEFRFNDAPTHEGHLCQVCLKDLISDDATH